MHTYIHVLTYACIIIINVLEECVMETRNKHKITNQYEFLFKNITSYIVRNRVVSQDLYNSFKFFLHSYTYARLYVFGYPYTFSSCSATRSM